MTPVSNSNIRIAGILIVIAGLGAAGVAIFSEQLGLGEEAARGMFGWKRISLLSVGAVIAAAGAFLVAFPQIVARWTEDERARGQAWLRVATSDRALNYLALTLLALLGITLAWTRLIYIDQSFWHDEAFTVVNFSSVGPGPGLLGEFFSYNNHVAFNFLSWLTQGVLGGSEPVYRLWSVVPGMVAIGIGAWWTWARIGRVAAVAFATIAVAGPLHLEWVPQARGYGLALLAATLMLVAADRIVHYRSRVAFLGLLASGLLGIWTLFTFSIAFLGQAVALLRWPRLRLPAIGVVAAGGALSLLFYAPVLGAILEKSAGRESGSTIPLTAGVLLDRPLEWLVIPTATMATQETFRPALDGSGVEADAPWATWVDVAALALLVVGVVALARRGKGGLAVILLVPPLFFNLVFSIGDMTTVARHQLFLLPYVVALVAAGIDEVARLIARPRFLKPVAIVVGVIAVLALGRGILEKGQNRVVPRENFKGVAEVVRGTGVETVVTDSNRPDGLRYYLGDDLIELPAEAVEKLLCNSDRQFVYIRHIALSSSSWGSWEPASLDCLASRDAARVRVFQRGRGRVIDVWVVDPAASREAIVDDVPYAPAS